jgi:thioredoxin-like negative regulator of GroEL
VLRRLESVRARIDSRRYSRPSAEELADVERTIGEWLDRLESEDYESGAQIADYLSLLEQIDAALVIAGSIAGLPQKQNRRLAAAIDRFYSAGFSERVDALKRLADRDPMNAAAAAARGGERALAASRFDDASAYFTLAARLAHATNASGTCSRSATSCTLAATHTAPGAPT